MTIIFLLYSNKMNFLFTEKPKKISPPSFKKPKGKMIFMTDSQKLQYFGVKSEQEKRDIMLRKIMLLKHQKNIPLKNAWDFYRNNFK